MSIRTALSARCVHPKRHKKSRPDEGRLISCHFPPPALPGSGSTVGPFQVPFQGPSQPGFTKLPKTFQIVAQSVFVRLPIKNTNINSQKSVTGHG
jgi:hypothetical protein